VGEASRPIETVREIRFRVTLNLDEIREAYDSEAMDMAWYREHPEEEGYGDEGYGPNVPPPFEVFAAAYFQIAADELETGGSAHYAFRVERVD
jgi:hypothetical protein